MIKEKAKDNLIKMSNYIDLYISKLLFLIDEIKIIHLIALG